MLSPALEGISLIEAADERQEALALAVAMREVVETPGRTAERPLRLANIAERSGISARVIGDPVEALAIARRQGDGSHVVVVTGSTFVTAVLREWWLDNVVESRR